MQIRTRLRLNSMIVFAVMLVVVVSLFWYRQEARRLDERMSLMHEMESTALERILLRDAYLANRSDRSRLQWQGRTDHFKELLEQANALITEPVDRRTLEEMGRAYAETVLIFGKLVSLGEGPSGTTGQRLLSSEAEEILFNRILVKAHTLVDRTRALRVSLERASKEAHDRLHVFLFLFAVIAVTIVIANSMVINHRLVKRIKGLAGATKVIGDGNLDHRVPVRGNDEFSELGRVTNEMTARLKESHTSIDNLQREIVERQRAEEALQQRETFIRTVLDNLPVGVAVNSVGPSVAFEYMNDNFPRFYRTTREALMKPGAFWDVVYEDEEFRESLRKSVEDACASGDAERMHWEDVPIARKGGETFFISARNIPIPERQLMISTVWDVTERKRTEEHLRFVNRLYATLSQVNQAVVRTREPEALFRAICRVALEYGGFRLCWAGLLDQQTGDVRPVAAEGEAARYVETIRINIYDEVLGSGPTGRALREENTVYTSDVRTDPRIAPWREAAVRYGLNSSVAVPFREAGKVTGVLHLYTSEQSPFSPQEVELLEEVAADISFALDSMASEQKRRAVEETLRESESRFRALFEHMSNCVAIYEAVDGGEDFIFRNFNGASEHTERISREAVIGRRVTEVFPGVRDFGLLAVFQRVWRTGNPERFPTSCYRDDRISGWRDNYVLRLPSGEVVAIYDDITERKQAEERLAEQLSELRRWQEVTLGREMRILELKREVNELTSRLGGPPRYTSVKTEESRD